MKSIEVKYEGNNWCAGYVVESFTIKELLDRIDTNGFPAKFILTKPLDNSHFKLYNV